MTKHTLEPTARQIADATSKPSFPGNVGTHDRLVRELAAGANGWR